MRLSSFRGPEVRRFLGLTSFFRRFVVRFAERAEPLNPSLKKNTEPTWGDSQLYHVNRETELHTDASAVGLAAMLLQKGDDCQMHLVYAISRRKNGTKRNYHSSKLELLAIIWATTRSRQLLINETFKVSSDCQALVYLSANKTKNP